MDPVRNAARPPGRPAESPASATRRKFLNGIAAAALVILVGLQLRRLRRDVRDGVISAEVALEVYAVAVDAQTHAIDEAATLAAREAVRARRLARGKPFAEFTAEWTTPGPQGLPAPYFGCWNDPAQIWVGNEEVPSPADALQPVTMDDPRLVRIRALEAEVAALRGAQGPER